MRRGIESDPADAIRGRLDGIKYSSPVTDLLPRIAKFSKLVILTVVLTVVMGAGQGSETRPAGNLDYWLSRSQTVTSQPSTRRGVNPFAGKFNKLDRDDAVPGVIEFSDGRQVAGGIFTTREEPITVWVNGKKGEKRWRRIPLISVLSISAVIVEQRMQLQWRWKETGAPERVYTGKKYPFRRFVWKFHLIDGSYVTGAVRGQPIRVQVPGALCKGKAAGPWLLHERSKGQVGTTLEDFVYLKRVIISRKMMKRVLAR